MFCWGVLGEVEQARTGDWGGRTLAVQKPLRKLRSPNYFAPGYEAGARARLAKRLEEKKSIPNLLLLNLYLYTRA